MTSAVLPLSDPRAIALCRLALGLQATSQPDNQLTAHTEENSSVTVVLAAALRAAIWAESNAGATPVHTTRVLNHAEQLARPAHRWPDERSLGNPAAASTRLRVTLDTVLDDLADHGDLARLPRGYWLPAPLRIVLPEQLGHALLIGGMPTPFLPDDERARIDHRGPSRLVRLPMTDWACALPEQPEDAWLRRPVGQKPLSGWASAVLDDASLGLPGTALVGDQVQLYRPDRAGTGATQHARWSSPGGSTTREPRRFLARRQTRAGREYQIVSVQDGKVLEIGDLPASVEVRRLLYGLDAAAGRPTIITQLRAARTVGYEIRSELPAAERRLLRALGGELTVPANGDYYPRCWTVHQDLAPRVERSLRDLGVKVQPSRVGE